MHVDFIIDTFNCSVTKILLRARNARQQWKLSRGIWKNTDLILTLRQLFYSIARKVRGSWAELRILHYADICIVTDLLLSEI